MEPAQPLLLSMENASGEEVNIRIEPEDDFYTFLDKAKSVLGYEMDITSLTQVQPLYLNENVYNFIINLEKNHPDMIKTLDPEADEYVLDDGTEIKASQIHFDNEDAPIDLPSEKLPFTQINNEFDEVSEEIEYEEVTYKISDSPIGSLTVDTKHNFINEVPFKLVCNNTTGFEAQFTKYLEESTKTYATLNNVTKKNKSPRSLIKDNFNTKDIGRYTREEILDMLKDSPVTSIPYEVNEKKHVRKTDPTRMIQKTTKTLDMDGLVIGDGVNRNCFICDRSVTEKIYIFDKEDQKIHRCSPQKITSTQLKVICEECLNKNFKPSRLKGANQFLNSEEYVVIKNNQQFVFQKVRPFEFRSRTKEILKAIDTPKVIDRSKKLNKNSKVVKHKDEFVKVEIGSDGEIVTKPIDKDDVIIITDERKDSSSDIELIEAEPEIDKIIDNLDDADEELKTFLGKYEAGNEVIELICRFCGMTFEDTSQVACHGELHKHQSDDDIVYPCPLCDYGYSNFKWLKGHVKAAHVKKEIHYKTDNEDVVVEGERKNGTSIETTVVINDTEKQDLKENVDDAQNSTEMRPPNLIIKTEVKQECLSSEDEIWIVQTVDDIPGLSGDVVKVENTGEKARKGHKCYECSKYFPSVETLSSHICRGNKHKCDDTILVPTKDDFMRNKRKKTDNSEIVTCNDCNQSFTSKVRLKFHMQFHTSNSALATNSLTCSECSHAFVTETELFDHVHFRHDKRKRWQCPVPHCGKTFYLRATLTRHGRSHTDTRRYVCVTCGKRFLDKQTLDEHSVTHLQTKPYQCSICLKQLSRVSRLRMHVRAHRERAAALIPACTHCGRAFTRAGPAQEHAETSKECIEAMAKYIKEEPTETPVQLSPTSGLVLHTIPVAKSPEPSEHKQEVASPISGPLSKLTEAARALIRIVEIDKAFRCEYCEDVFYTEEGLNKHRAIHKGVKNAFTCHICKVSFATYSRCTTHKTTHGLYKRGLNELPDSDFPVVKHFLCEDCGRSYLHWTYLQVHRRMKHPNENFQHKCTHCEMTFPNSWSLAYHRKKLHGKSGQRDPVKPVSQDYKIPCRDCEEVLPNKNALYKHRKKEHSDASIQDNDDFDSSGLNLHESAVSSRPPERAWACARCPKRLRTRAELRSHTRTKHPQHIAVIEFQGVNPTTEDILNLLNAHGISQDKIIEINYMSFIKGTRNIVPNCARALSMLSTVPKIQVSWTRPLQEAPQEEEYGVPIIPIRRPRILQNIPKTDMKTDNNINQIPTSHSYNKSLLNLSTIHSRNNNFVNRISAMRNDNCENQMCATQCTEFISSALNSNDTIHYSIATDSAVNHISTLQTDNPYSSIVNQISTTDSMNSYENSTQTQMSTVNSVELNHSTDTSYLYNSSNIKINAIPATYDMSQLSATESSHSYIISEGPLNHSATYDVDQVSTTESSNSYINSYMNQASSNHPADSEGVNRIHPTNSYDMNQTSTSESSNMFNTYDFNQISSIHSVNLYDSNRISTTESNNEVSSIHSYNGSVNQMSYTSSGFSYNNVGVDQVPNT